METKVKLSSVIKSKRENIGMTQSQLAEKIGISRHTIIRYEAGETKPEYDKFIKICEVLGMNVKDFIGKEVE